MGVTKSLAKRYGLFLTNTGNLFPQSQWMMSFTSTSTSEIRKYVKIRTAKFGVRSCLLDGLLYIATRGKEYPSALSLPFPSADPAAMISYGDQSSISDSAVHTPEIGEPLNAITRARRRPHCHTCHRPMKGHKFSPCPRNVPKSSNQDETMVEVGTRYVSKGRLKHGICRR
jgi:hypothetical protein